MSTSRTSGRPAFFISSATAAPAVGGLRRLPRGAGEAGRRRSGVAHPHSCSLLLGRRGAREGDCMNADALRQTVAGLMPGLRADLERLVRLPSVAFEGFPEEPVKQAGDGLAELMKKAGLPEVRLVDIARAPQTVF